MEAALLLGNTVEADLLTLGITVLLDVLLGALEDDRSLLLVELLALLELGRLLGAGLLLALALLEEGLGDEDLVLGRDGTIVNIRLVRSPRITHDKCMNRAPVGELPIVTRHSQRGLTRWEYFNR